MPSNFKTDFFFCSDNKARLYGMMAGYFATLARDSATGTQYFITQGSSEVSGALPDSTHLEADFRLVGHMLYAARNGCSRTIVRGNDTDICILVSYSWPTYQHYSNATAPTSCYLTVGLVPHGLCSTSITLGILLGWPLERCQGLLFV